MSRPDDPYSRVDYRRLIAWPERIRREEPFLLKVLSSAPSRRLLDLGCGTGEHSRFLASRGFEVTGVDVSEEMLRKASEVEMEGVTFVSGDLGELDALLSGTFGGAICLGNTVPHLAGPARLEAFLRGLRARLLPGSPLILQVLNYERILSRKERALPLNFRPGDTEGEEIVFLRLMTPRADGTVFFNPTTLRYRPGAEPPVEVVSARNVQLRGWRESELEPRLIGADFAVEATLGGMEEQPYDPAGSSDLVIVARRL